VRDERWLQGVVQQINADAEMGFIGRYFDATIAFTFGTQRFDLLVAQGKVAEIRQGGKIDHRVDFGFRASDATWDKFFQYPPEPLYSSVFGMIMRIADFHLDGDGMVLAQNARAATRLLDIMQSAGSSQ
jgi:hypothetical protein